MTTTSETPRIYIASLTDYNEGRLIGEWFDLDDYSDSDEILGAIGDYLNSLNEKQPLSGGEIREEWAAHDYENFPESLYSESMDFEAFYEYWNAVQDMDEETAEAFEIFCNNSGEEMNAETLEKFQDAYYGKFDAYKVNEDFGYQYAEESGDLASIPEHLKYYFNDEAYGRDLLMSDFWESKGYVFRNL